MRKSVKILLIIASSLVGIGILFLSLSVAMGGAEMIFKPKGNRDYKVMTATFDEVEALEIKDVSNDVRIVKSETDRVKVTYATSKDFGYYLKQLDGTLYIEFEDFRHWYNYLFNFYSVDCDLVVEVPEKTLNELSVKCTSSDIEAKAVNSLVTTLKTTSGDIEVGGSVGDLTVTATSGDVKLNSDITARCVVVSTTSGKLELSGNVSGDLIADNTSGGIIVNDLKCENADLKTTSGKVAGNNLKLTSVKADTVSGEICFTDTVCTGDMTLEATSGSVNLENVDAENYDLHTTSGSIEAEILTPKLYNVKTTSGSERIPEFDETAEGVFSAKTTSGNIKIKLAE